MESLGRNRSQLHWLTIGTAERGSKPNDPPLGELVDEIIQETPCPVMAVHANVDGVEGLAEESVSRILLPTVGAEYNRHAAEVAFAIARNRNALVEIVHVVNEPRIGDRFMEEPDLREARQIGEEIVDEEAELGRKMGAEIRTNVVVSDREPEDELVELASDTGMTSSSWGQVFGRLPVGPFSVIRPNISSGTPMLLSPLLVRHRTRVAEPLF